MTNTLIDNLEKDIDSTELEFIIKSKTEKGIYLLYDDCRADDDKLCEIYKKHKDFEFTEIGGYLPFEKLEKEYGLKIDEISEKTKKYLERWGKDLVCFELRE